MLSRRLTWRAVLALVTLTWATAAWAQPTTVTFAPSAPTAADVITAQIRYQGLVCAFIPTTTVVGTTVRTDVEIFGCVVGPPSGTLLEYVPFGPLPAGTYSYELYFRYDQSPPVLRQVQQPLVVSAAPAAIPALQIELLVLLGVGLALIAIFVLRRF